MVLMLLAALPLAGRASGQLTWIDQFSTFASGPLAGQQDWTQVGGVVSLPIQITGGTAVIPGGQTVDNQDVSKPFSVAGFAGNTAVYGMRFTVTSAINTSSPSYFAGLVATNGFVNARLAVRVPASSTNGGDFQIGMRLTGQAGNPFQFGGFRLRFGREYLVLVEYKFLGASASDDQATLYINPIAADMNGARTVFQAQSVANGDMPACASLALSQFGSAGVPSSGVAVSAVATGNSLAAVFNALYVPPPPEQDAIWQNPGPCSIFCFNAMTDVTNWSPGLPGINGRATFGSSNGALQQVSGTGLQFGETVVNNQTVRMSNFNLSAGSYLGVADDPGEQASLEINNGWIYVMDASWNIGEALVGAGAGSLGQIKVGPSGTCLVGGLLLGADGGSADLRVEQGGYLGAYDTIIGGQSGSATATVDGAGSYFECESLQVGSLGGNSSGQLTLSNSAVMRVFLPLSIAGTELHPSLLDVRTGAELSLQDRTVVHGDAALRVREGGSFITDPLNPFMYQYIDVYGQAGHPASVSVEGPTSSISVGGIAVADVGPGSAGTLIVADGGTVHASNNVQIRPLGVLQGNGTIDCPLQMAGLFQPGLAGAGKISVTGDLDMQPTSRTQIEIGGATPVSQHDQVVCLEQVMLDGQLEISLIGGFEPLSGQTFDVLLSAPSGLAGTFDSVVGTAIGSDLRFTVEYLSDRVRLAVVASCPGDLNGDQFVDDADFVIFASAYDILDCADPAMPAGCPADMNSDGVVDDSDFVLFAGAYNELLCP